MSVEQVYEPRIPIAAADLCPACGHPLDPKVHGDNGCEDGWEWDFQGVAVTEGCGCVLAIAPGQQGML